tara:strand:+ start:1759 stop:2592 length:834 start_codon:yes stop_codon:yes gene_type:complete
MESNQDLTVIIVTFNSEDKIFSCIETIPSNINIFVIENSDNIKLKTLLENKYRNVKCILTGENKGYAVANNIGLKLVKTNYALVLNPDTKLKENAIVNFFNFSKIKKDFWLVGPYNNQSKEKIIGENIFEVKNIKGFAIFFNINKFDQDFFDENFFLYFEEIDLCENVKKKGGTIFLDKNILIDHEGAGSVKKIEKIELEKSRNWHWMWSTFYFHKKHKGFLYGLVLILPKCISAFLKFIFYSVILNKEKKEIYFFRLSGIINSVLGKKSWYRPSID